MTAIAEAIEGLATVIDTMPGLKVTDHVPGTTMLPAAFFDWDSIEYDRADDSGGTITLGVVLLVGTQLSRNQKQLLPWVFGPSSIQATLQANRNLGGLDVDCHATFARRLGLEEIAAYNAFGAVVTVQLRLG